MSTLHAPTSQALARDELRALAASTSTVRVSIHLPLRPFPDAAQNPVRARQAADAATKLLAALPLADPERSRLMDRLGSLEALVSAQPQPHGGLAVFLDAEHFHVVPIAIEPAPHVGVGHCFALRPVLRALSRDVRYRVLAVSVRRVALFEGDARGLEPVPSEGIPASLEDALGSELSEKQLRMRGTAAGGGAPVFYAHDVASEEQKRDLARFHHVLGRALTRHFTGDATPLVLASDVVHQAGLRAETRVSGLLAEGVPISPDHVPPAELHTRAWPLVSAELARREREARSLYERARNVGKALDRLDDVAMAAVSGRVRRLWLDADRALPGRVDRGTGRILASSGSDDVLDSLAEIVLAKAGEVIVVDAVALPSASGMAAELH